MDEVKLRSGILRRVAITKNGDLDISLRFASAPDAGYTLADKLFLEACWSQDDLFDVTLAEASDVRKPDPITGEV